MNLGILHFIRPEWLLLAPMVIVTWYFLKRLNVPTSWENHLPQAMLSVLRVKQSHQRDNSHWTLLILWLGMVIAAAGPSWVKQTIPTVQNQNSMVFILDLSPSMLAQDIKPDRLTRAKYELQDILHQVKDSQIALVAYSGSAHTVSPLTDDPKTLASLLPALSPRFMPELGSHLEAAVELAQQLLTDAGVSGGDILLITDGITQQAAQTVGRQLKASRSLSILAVAGTDPTPIPAEDGGFLRNKNGEIVLTELAMPTLQGLAQSTGGRFSMLTADDADTHSLVQDHLNQAVSNNETTNNDIATRNTEFDDWVDKGHWFIFLILPFALLCFRKGLIYCLPYCLLSAIMLTPQPLEATESKETNLTNTQAHAQIHNSTNFNWRDMFTTKDQQAAQLMKNGDYQTAANRFKQAEWSAVAHYRHGDYAKSIEQLNEKNDVTSLYNKGNALALNGNLEQAIDTYHQVLTLSANHEDAIHNKQILEDLVRQQNNQEQPKQQENSNKSGPQDQVQQQEKSASPSQPSNNNEQQSKQQSSQAESEQTSQQTSPSKTGSTKGDNGGATANNDDTKALSEQSQKQADAPPQSPEQQTPPTATENLAEKNSKNKPDAESTASSEDGTANNSSSKSRELAAQSITKGDTLPENPGTPLADSSEQWLRSIQNDPSGLLRRKFEYQTWQRAQQQNKSSATASIKEERY